MYGHTSRDNIRNIVIREKVGVTFVGNKMRKATLKIWFGQCEGEVHYHPSKEAREAGHRVYEMGRGRPKSKIHLVEVIRHDMIIGKKE